MHHPQPPGRVRPGPALRNAVNAGRHAELAQVFTDAQRDVDRDVVVAAQGAKIGDPHVSVGLVAGDGGAFAGPAGTAVQWALTQPSRRVTWRSLT